MTKYDLRNDFHNEQGIKWINSQGEPDIDYVEWLENKILAVKNNAVLPHVSISACSRCGAKTVSHPSKLCYGCWMLSDP